MKTLTLLLISILFITLSMSCGLGVKREKADNMEIISLNGGGQGETITITFEKGKEHNHPLMAIWLEDTLGQYIQTLYVSQSIAKGTFAHGDISKGYWKPAEKRRPASLPYWAYKRGVREADGLYIPTPQTAIADAYTGPTPKSNFMLKTNADYQLPSKFSILMEINQSWDWNEYWTNDKYPNDVDYKTSSQPAIIYKADIDTNSTETVYTFTAIGHSHYSGANGNLYTDLSTLTTAKNIIKHLSVKIMQVSDK